MLIPSLTVTSSQSAVHTTARIRGIGTVGDKPGLESSVGVVIDGVYRPRNGVGFGDLGQIERIEVLKGPQGTVFGKNTSAGVINVVTRLPSYTQSAEGEITVGNYGAFGVSGSYNDALGDARSEEHTSELQSLMRISYAVFCLNKKQYIIQHTHLHNTNDTGTDNSTTEFQ